MLLIILKNAANCKVVNGESGVTNLRDSRKGRRGRRPRTRGSALLLKFLQCLAGFGKIWVGGQSLPELLGGVALFSLLQQNNSKPVIRGGGAWTSDYWFRVSWRAGSHFARSVQVLIFPVQGDFRRFRSFVSQI